MNNSESMIETFYNGEATNPFILITLIIWCFIGSIGGLWLSRKLYPKTTIGDLIFLFTIGGISGLLTIFIAISYIVPKSRLWNKKVF